MALKSTVSATRSAIVTKGMLPPNAKSLRSNPSVALISPPPPSRSTVKVSASGFVTPRRVNVPETSKPSGLVLVIFVE